MENKEERIIHCKDCNYWLWTDHKQFCDYWHDFTEPWDFCSNGEKRVMMAFQDLFYYFPKPRRRMMNSRDKGCRGERELANKLKEYGYNARRGAQYCGANGDADVIGLDGIHIEVKRTERLSLYDALAQAKSDAKGDEMPVIMHRKNNCEWVVVQPLEDWIALYREWRVENVKK